MPQSYLIRSILRTWPDLPDVQDCHSRALHSLLLANSKIIQERVWKCYILRPFTITYVSQATSFSPHGIIEPPNLYWGLGCYLRVMAFKSQTSFALCLPEKLGRSLFPAPTNPKLSTSSGWFNYFHDLDTLSLLKSRIIQFLADTSRIVFYHNLFSSRPQG